MIDGRYAIDYQVHSTRSHDGNASILDQCLRAAELGLNEIGFSEHKDFDPADPVVDYFDYDAYMRDIETTKKRFHGVLEVRAGVEIDYQSWFDDQISEYLRSHAFDFVIGSVHYVNREMIMTPEYNRSRCAHTAYRDYFRAVSDSVTSGLFDIVGHLEYANRRGVAAWGPYDPVTYRVELTEIFDRMIERGVALEINTAGLHQNVGLTYPCADSVSLYRQRGGSLLCVGSDAHHPDQLGHAYTAATDIGLANGFNELCTWNQRHVRLVPLFPTAGSTSQLQVVPPSSSSPPLVE